MPQTIDVVIRQKHRDRALRSNVRDRRFDVKRFEIGRLSRQEEHRIGRCSWSISSLLLDDSVNPNLVELFRPYRYIVAIMGDVARQHRPFNCK
jgi:hypothetical protein